MRYAAARFRQEEERRVFEVYVTDALKLMAENTARYGGGGYIKARYHDILHPKPEETRTAAEVIAHIVNGLKGGVRN